MENRRINTKRGGGNIVMLSLYVLLFVAYYSQGFLYPEGSLISQSSVLLLLVIGLIYYGNTFIYLHKPFVINAWLFFYFVQALTFLFSPKEVNGTLYEAIGRTTTFEWFKGISVFMLSLCVGYVLSRKTKGGIQDKYILYIGLAFLVMSIARYFYMLNAERIFRQRDDVTNNGSYFLVCLLPYFPYLLKRSKALCFAVLILVVLLIMVAAKRGAIVCMVVALGFSLLYYLKVKKASLRTSLLTVALAVGFGFLIYNIYESNDWLLKRVAFMQANGIGGRAIAYPILFGHWYSDTNLWTLLFGNGMAQSVTLWGNFAHNDWLELLISNGIVGVALYLVLFGSVVRWVYRSALSTIPRLSAYLCLVVWFMQSLFSMGFFSMYNGMYVLLLGMIIGSVKYRLKTNVKL